MSELTEQNLTRQQAEQEMACLRKIYASVRLLNPRRRWRRNPATRPEECPSLYQLRGARGNGRQMPVLQAGNAWQLLYQVTAR